MIAKGRQTALMPGNEDKVGYWLMPPEKKAVLFAEFDIDTDPTPFPRPDGYDGLKVEWGKSNYVNPPFRGGNAWVNKAIEENRKGKTVVFVLACKRDLLKLVQAGAEFRPLVDVGWLNPDGKRQKGAGWPTVLAILRPKP